MAILPYKAVGYDPKQHPSHICFPADSLVCRMVKNALVLLRERAPSLEVSEGEALARGFGGLVRGIMSPSEVSTETRAATDKAKLNIFKQYIEQNLRDPEITIYQTKRKKKKPYFFYKLCTLSFFARYSK